MTSLINRSTRKSFCKRILGTTNFVKCIKYAQIGRNGGPQGDSLNGSTQFCGELCVIILSRRRGHNLDRIGKMKLQRKVKRRNVKATDITGDEFESRWLQRLGLPSAWREPARKHLEQLCFSVLQDTWPLIESLFTVVPEILNREPERMDLAEAYGRCCYAFWQCESAFPSFPERFASFLLQQLQAGECRNLEISSLLASLFADADDPEKWGGFNHPQLARPEVIRAHERVVKHGEYEKILNAQIKYDEFERQIQASTDLKKEWAEIKRLFPNQTTGRDIIHRSLVPERNWVRGPGADFGSDASAFQAVFDVFSWKYYLWAMKGDEPLLMKPSVVFTPFGTQIFIPGYISFDSKRDLKFGVVSRLHRARGIRRQGEGFSVGRIERAAKATRAFELNEQAKAAGLKGDERLRFVANKLGISGMPALLHRFPSSVHSLGR